MTAATLYYDVSNGMATSHLVTNNLTSYYYYLSTALVPTILQQNCGGYPCISSVELVSDSSIIYMVGNISSTTTLYAGTNYIDVYPNFEQDEDPLAPDGFDVFYDCVYTSNNLIITTTTSWSPLMNSMQLQDQEFILPIPTSVTDLNNPNTTTLSLSLVFNLPDYINSYVLSLYPFLSIPNCTGVGEGFPSPKVVVSLLTVTIGSTPTTSATAQPASSPTDTGEYPSSTAVSDGSGGVGSYTGGSGNLGSGSNGSGRSGGSDFRQKRLGKFWIVWLWIVWPWI